MSEKPNYIDLFCGAGGFSLGFDGKGFENCFSLDIQPAFCETYKANFPTHHLIQDNILNLTKSDIQKITKNNPIDIVIGGPPCQGFSMAGNIGRRFVDDPRNHLFNEFARIVEITQPKYFVMENVARLYTHNKGETRQEIIALFKKKGYNVDCKVLNTADYGVAQVRNRVFFIGNRISDYIIFPEKTLDKPKTVAEVLAHYTVLKSNEISDMPNHVAMKHSEQMLRKMQFVTDGGDRSEIPELLRPQTGDVRKYIRYRSDKPAICITGDMRKVFHYNQNRALTVRELASIQSFPDTFVFKGSTISQQQQVGNAVPPLMAEIIAQNILNMMAHDNNLTV